MTRDEMKARTKSFALRVMKMVDHLPKTQKAMVPGNQILRSATSVAANYRAACRGRSDAEFAAKLGTAVEEADETGLWLELISEGGLLPAKQVRSLLQEADELTAVLFTSCRTMRSRLK
jgi:four helix bundle protein